MMPDAAHHAARVVVCGGARARGTCARTARMRARLARARACHNMMTCLHGKIMMCTEWGVYVWLVALVRGVWRGAAPRIGARDDARITSRARVRR